MDDCVNSLSQISFSARWPAVTRPAFEDKPIIQYFVDEALVKGIEDVLIITGRSKRMIEEPYNWCIELELNLAAKGKNEWLEMVRNVSGILIHRRVMLLHRKCLNF